MYSFDVFDTLITRTTATPTGIFALMQETLLTNTIYAVISEHIKRNFYSLRINAERLARQSYCVHDVEDITLEQIYDTLATTGNLNVDEQKKLMELEKAIEYENVVGIQDNITKVKCLLEQREHVVLISDMYLDEKTIRNMLIKIDEVFINIPIYVSAEYKKGKYTKNLYKIVRNLEQADFKQWTHCGDNLHSDIKMAKKLGIRTNHFSFTVLMDYEKKVLEHQDHDVFIQLTIGTARNTRLRYKLSDIADIGCSMGGVILFPYVWWLIQESLRKGIRRLYFIARDGFLLKKIADIIIQEYQYDMDTSYIYGSRKAWRMPSFSEKNHDIYKFIQWSHGAKIKSIEAFAEVFQIPVEVFQKYLPVVYQDETVQLTPYAIRLLAMKLNQDEAFKRYLIRVHQATRNLVVAYLQQEIDVSDDAFAFVELSGGGFTQGCLAEIMSDFYDKPIQTFFFKMDNIKVMDNCIYYNFMPSALYLTLIVEMLCRAPHGQTIGYTLANERMVPVLKDDEGGAIIQHGFYEYTAGLEDFTHQYVLLRKHMLWSIDKLDLVFRYIEYITKTPDEKTLSFFASMPNSESGREKDVVEFAPVLSKRTIRLLFLFYPKEPLAKNYKGSSLEYSLLRCSARDKKRIHLYKTRRNEILARLKKFMKRQPKENHSYGFAEQFPCELLAQRIVLYAAGSFGQDLYRKLQSLKKTTVVKWIDKNYKTYQKENLPVSSLDSIDDIVYDQIVIAVLDKDIADNIRKTLRLRNISNEKIVWINLQFSWF